MTLINYLMKNFMRSGEEENMPTVKLSLNIDHYQAFDMLCQSLHVNLKEDPPEFVVEDGEIVVKDFDDRGELYMISV